MNAKKGALSVLVVDDSPIVCDVAAEALTEAGFRVCTRTTAIALSGVVRATRPDLIVLDIEMPGLTGVDACSRIRHANPGSKILLFSSVRNLQQLAETCKADGWLPKQQGVDQLAESVRRVASSR